MRKAYLLLSVAVALLAWLGWLSWRRSQRATPVLTSGPMASPDARPDAGPPQPPADAGSTGTESPPAEANEPQEFYGRKVRLLKLFGQTTYREATRDLPNGHSQYHAPGVVVDRSAKPNRVYIVDSGNSRVLAFRALGTCAAEPGRECTNETDCAPGDRCALNPSRDADLIFGQPDAVSGACNGDVNVGLYGPASASSLCLLEYPRGTNTAEQWQRINFDVDARGNLYLGDAYNNRVLRFDEPFSADKSGGKGDTLPELVIGQEDFTSNKPNRGSGSAQRDARSLDFETWWHTTTRGSVSVDPAGNVWVADLGNRRVLRFPPGQGTADLVLGQRDFTSFNEEGCSPPQPAAFELDRLCHPLLARVHPTTGELYVLDGTGTEGPFASRILLFRPPFTPGMAATRVITPRYTGPVAGWTDTYFLQASGFEFNRSTEEPYKEGVLWVSEHGAQRVLLLDAEGNVVAHIGTRSLAEAGGDAQYAGCPYDIYQDKGLWSPGGSLGMDDAGNLYFANESLFHNVIRHRLPYAFVPQGGQLCPPHPDAVLSGRAAVAGHKLGESVGVAVFRNQLIVRDERRLLVWNNYLDKPWGAPADVVVNQSRPDTRDGNPFQFPSRAFHAIDDAQRLWTLNEHGPLMVFQLPFTARSAPLARSLELYWADTGARVEYRADGVAFDPIQRKLWIADLPRHRLLRVSDYADFSKRLHVDMVLGQVDKAGGECNQGRGPDRPTAATLCHPLKLQFDRRGNLYVVENTYECHGNNRISVFLAEELAAAAGMFPGLEAKRIFNMRLNGNPEAPHGCGGSAENVPASPVTLAFNSRNEAVIGSDGYYADAATRHWKQLYFYRDPIASQAPDASIRLPMGAPGDLAFDDQDHLIVQDHTWYRTWIIDLREEDEAGRPIWLEPLTPSTGED